MKSKLFLTSLTAIAIAMPAMAEPSNTESTFPSNELMLQDTTYQNQANYTNMGVYTGEVSANAEYEWNIIPIVAGTYLPGGQTSTTQCTTGNFCPGIATNNTTRTPHYQTVQEGDQGLTSCSTTTNGVYTGSAAGATASTDCYRSCANSDITHATGITGNVYYNGTDGDGVKDCTPTACENGWHVKAAVPAPDLNTAIGNDYPSSNPTSNTITHTYSVTYSAGTLTGTAQCSTQEGTRSGGTPTMLNSLPDSGGWYCYCQLTSWQPTGQSTQSLSGFWVYATNEEGATSNCASTCTEDCAAFLLDPSTWRTAFLNSIQSNPAMCEANTITITWNGASAADISANNAGTATYDGDIRTPAHATPVTGKTFKGWRFEKPTPSQGD